ncbi:hypothetical protein, partial [Salmonella enterica]|uniref:hypothetical protein n=1 Tax=Salmonella enterica TaxID=28901 RepID=UPI0020C52D29
TGVKYRNLVNKIGWKYYVKEALRRLPPSAVAENFASVKTSNSVVNIMKYQVQTILIPSTISKINILQSY